MNTAIDTMPKTKRTFVCRRMRRWKRFKMFNRGQRQGLSNGEMNATMLLTGIVAGQLRRRRQVAGGGEKEKNELFRIVSTGGPRHAPVFTAETNYNGQVFTGSGCTKAQARQQAAKLALELCTQTPDPSLVLAAMRGQQQFAFLPNNNNNQTDFSDDVSTGLVNIDSVDDSKVSKSVVTDAPIGSSVGLNRNVQSPINKPEPNTTIRFLSKPCASVSGENEPQLTGRVKRKTPEAGSTTSDFMKDGPLVRATSTWSQQQTAIKAKSHEIDESLYQENQLPKSCSSGLGRHTDTVWSALSVLLDLRPSASFQHTRLSGGVDSRENVKVSVTVDGQQFVGVGSSTKQAKEQAARLALRGAFQLNALVDMMLQCSAMRRYSTQQ